MLGNRVTDRITGFTGVVIGYVQYITGCNQVLVVPPVKEDGSMVDSHWIDEQRLEVLAHDPIVLENGDNPGADKAPPKI